MKQSLKTIEYVMNQKIQRLKSEGKMIEAKDIKKALVRIKKRVKSNIDERLF